MKNTNKNLIVTIIIILMITPFFLFPGYSKQNLSTKEGRETVLDRVIHIEKDLITEIPTVERWCDRLELKKYRINVGDCKLYVEEEGEGIPIVLLHGGPGSTHHGFHPYFSSANKFARVIYYDQRGCGVSDYQRGEKYTADQAVDDLENLRKKLNIQKWVVLGHSYGGLLAQRYSLKYPESFAGIVLVGSSLGMEVDLKSTRQYDYISDDEKQRMRQIQKEIAALAIAQQLSNERKLELIVFNNHLNGDWKRQSFYKPTREEIAQTALYEWKPAPNFRKDMHKSIYAVDVEGAFENCPIPTLILEGTWDLTWNTDKPEILYKNHPGSHLLMFERSGHSPFEDEPERFFSELEFFVENLPEIHKKDIAAWKEYLEKWRKAKADPFLVSEMRREEAVAIEEFYRVRKKILTGERVNDLSTPLHSFLTLLSALHHQDLDANKQVRPGVRKNLYGTEKIVTKEDLAKQEKRYINDEILRAPIPPQYPEPFQLWPIYMKDETQKELGETYLFIYWNGKWRWAGNRAVPGDWRKNRDFFINDFKTKTRENK